MSLEPTAQSFLLLYPEFNKPKYTNALLSVWLDVAISQVNVTRWASQYAFGVLTLTAHYLTIYGDTDSQVGLLTSNNVDGVNYSLDINRVTNEDGASFNSSKYGVQYFQLAKMKGAGPLSSLASRPCYM